MHIKYSINLLPGRRIGHKTKAKAGQTKPCQWTHDPVTFPPLPVSRFPHPLSQSPFPQSRSHKQLNTAAACNMCLSTYTHIYIYLWVFWHCRCCTLRIFSYSGPKAFKHLDWLELFILFNASSAKCFCKRCKFIGP